MKHCPKCGTQISAPNAKFCPRCGAPVSDTPPQASVSWPPESFVRRKRTAILVVVVLAVVVLAALFWMVAFGWFSRPAQTADAPLQDLPAVTDAASAEDESQRLYCENLTAADGLRMTLNGKAVEYGVAEDGRVYLDRKDLTQTDTLLRAILPSGDGWQTTLALVSKPSNPTASFGTLTLCDEEGYNDPDESYLDAMLSVYYRAQLQAFNSRKVEDLRFSSDLNDQSWEESITLGAYDAVVYNLDQSDMTFTTAGLVYGDRKVTLNAAGQWTGTNRTSGQTESGTDYMTIQAIWRDGIWQIDRCVPCTQQDYENGTLKLS